MPTAPDLTPLPSPEGRGGKMRGGYTCVASQIFAAHRHPYHAAKLVICMWILAVGVRLILIAQPYIDHWSWRQSDVAAIAQNFWKNGFRFAYPQVDWAGDATGYVGTE